jgi:uncharacterized protein (TIGR00369 family)
MQNPERSRTFTWDDPAAIAKTAPTLSGLDFLLAMQRGELPPPPVMRMLNMSGAEFFPNRAIFSLVPAEYHFNPIGSVHGGVISTILDTAMSCAVHTTLPAGVGYTTVDLHINFLRPIVMQTGLIRCEGEVINAGRTIITAGGRLVDAEGKLYAHGTATCIVLR